MFSGDTGVPLYTSTTSLRFHHLHPASSLRDGAGTGALDNDVLLPPLLLLPKLVVVLLPLRVIGLSTPALLSSCVAMEPTL